MKNKKIALITGILGQDGPYLAKLLLEKNYKVYGLVNRRLKPNFLNTDFLGITRRIKFVYGDMTDETSLKKIIKSIRPKEIYNLAGQSHVGNSWSSPKATTEVNSLGVLYILNAIKSYAPSARFYQASSCEMFGRPLANEPITETTPFKPCSPYAISKLYAYWLTNNFRESYGLFCCNGILFNHESPLRGEEYVTRKISLGVAKIKLGLASEISLGNLDSKKDWGYAGDYVKAMHLMLQQKRPSDYLVATGQPHTIRDFLKAAFNRVGIKDWNKYVKTDQKFMRPIESLSFRAKPNKARKILGWKPKTNFNELVKIMVEADLKRLRDK